MTKLPVRVVLLAFVSAASARVGLLDERGLQDGGCSQGVWYDANGAAIDPVTTSSCVGGSIHSGWIVLQPDACHELPHLASGCQSGFCSFSEVTEMGLSVETYVATDKNPDAYVDGRGVKYLGNGDKVNVAVVDVASDLPIDAAAAGGCTKTGGGWFSDEDCPSAATNPLLGAPSGLKVVVENVGSSSKDVRVWTRCNAETCNSSCNGSPSSC